MSLAKEKSPLIPSGELYGGVTPTEKKFGIEEVEVKCFEGEGEVGLYGMICVCEEGSMFNGKGGIREFGDGIEGSG